jgi:hypothetical protein
MKRLLYALSCASTAVMPTLLLSALLALVVLPSSAADRQASSDIRLDTLWGAYCYRELNGEISGVSRRKTPFTAMPLRKGEAMVYYVLADKSEAAVSLVANAAGKGRALLNVKIIEVNTNKEVCNKTVKAGQRKGEKPVTVAKGIMLPSKSWYRIELTAPSWPALQSVDYLLFANNSGIGIKPSPIFMAPSVHLTNWGSTDPAAPKGEAYDWAYMEVMLPKKYERKNTYVMSLGVLSGYMGMQTVDDSGEGLYSHRVLFSMWDKGDTDADSNLPDYLRSGALDSGYDVRIRRFGGEGTGTQAMVLHSPWQCDNWVQFITACRPEKLDITVKGSHGQDSTIEYTNTLVSAWYKEAGDSEWHYLATLREAGRNHYMAGWYSFLENFTDDGGEFYRRAYYRNGYLHSLADGKWHNRNEVNFGHTQGKPHEPRYDYGHGATSLYPNCFYLEQGGYTLCANDSAHTVPLATDNTPVDTIDLNALWQRAEQAMRKESTRGMDVMIAQAAEQPDKLAAFKALAKRYIDHAGKFGYYKKEDMADLTAAYNNGRTDDAAGLAQELRYMAFTANSLKCGKVARVEHLGCTRGYQILTLSGALAVGAGNKLTCATDSVATDNSRNWRITRQGDSDKVVVRNIATGLYLAPTTATMLSTLPAILTVKALDGEGNFAIFADDKRVECQIIDNYFVQ